MAEFYNNFKKKMKNCPEIDLSTDTIKINLVSQMAPAQQFIDDIKDQMELNIKLTSAVIYMDTGREPKMWDINTPMPVKGDSQILAHVKF